MDIVERLRSVGGIEGTTRWYINPDGQEAAQEIERLREALETFANNVKETNEGIDENWSKTVYPLKAENQRLREALKEILTHETDYEPYDCIEIARSALKGDE